MNINIISESTLSPKQFGGMHTAFLNHLSLLKTQNHTIAVNRLWKSDITHVHTIGPFAFWKLLTSKHTVASSHLLPESFIGSYQGGNFFQPMIRAYLRFFYNKADIIIALTKKTEKDLRALGVTSNIIVLPNPIDNRIFYKGEALRKKGREKYHIEKEQIVILGTGNIIPRKGIADFIALAKRFPDIKFIWAGGNVFAQFLSAKQEDFTKNVPQNLTFIGHVINEKMPLVYNTADIFLFPSYQEIAPMAILEAASCGLPLILRDLPEYKELYQEDYLGAKNIDEFAKAIKQLQKKDAFYQQKVKASFHLASRFSYETIGKELLTCYQSLLGGK
jgi:1,2-diacylglycerol-3-alpha-glucose alpha-1,2-galactosyltransferase